MIAFPNAKINMGLQVLNKRSDGYHNLETVFYPVNIHDMLEIVEADKTTLSLSGIAIPASEDNLCIRAYKLLKEDFSLPDFHIYLHKIIPVGAGLGGGSSDAAFLIKLINDYCELQLSTDAMRSYASRLGADCAFFMENKAVFAEGVGDRLSPVDLDLSDYKIVVIRPPIHINTAQAFSGIKPRSDGQKLKEQIEQPADHWKQTVFNDFEDTVFLRYPAIAGLKQKLYEEGAVYASMSGSGSSVFGIFDKAIRLAELEENNDVFYC